MKEEEKAVALELHESAVPTLREREREKENSLLDYFILEGWQAAETSLWLFLSLR